MINAYIFPQFTPEQIVGKDVRLLRIKKVDNHIIWLTDM